mgnify:CR=1 FL=1
MATTINLDFVGLNTLVNEPITSSTNTIGHALGTTSSAYVNTITIGDNDSISIAHDDYLVALNIHRNGPYGTPIFKQLRAANNPLTRYHNRNNIFSYVTDQGRIRQSFRNNRVTNSFRERRSKLRQIVETPVYENKPITIVGSVTEIDPRTGKEIKQRVEIKASFNNETQYFGNRKTNRELEADFEIDEGYEQLTDLYLDGGLDADDSPIDEVELVKYETTIYPRQEVVGRTNRRPNFIYKPWHSDRQQRQDGPFIDTGFGYFIPSQSLWPLDIGPDESGLPVLMHRPALQDSASIGKDPADHVGFQKVSSEGDTTVFDHYPGILNFSPDFGNDKIYDGIVSPRYAFFQTNNSTSSSFNPYGIPYEGNFPLVTVKSNMISTENYEGAAFLATTSPFLGTTDSVVLGGSQKWEAPKFSGRTPFYDSYEEYCELISKLGNTYTVVPEFIMSDFVEEFSNKGKLSAELLSKALLSITGGIESSDTSAERGFYKIYSTTDFLKNFDIIQEDHDDFINPFKLTLKCKSILKFLPYEGFYPVERTVELSKKFFKHYSKNLIYENSRNTDNPHTSSAGHFQAQMNALFAPGVLFNTIKSGMACDYPINTDFKSAFDFKVENGANPTKYANYVSHSTSFASKNRKARIKLSNSDRLLYTPDFQPFVRSTASGNSQPIKIFADSRLRQLSFAGNSSEDEYLSLNDGTVTINFNERVPFEAIITPGEFLRNKKISCIDSDSAIKRGSSIMTARDNKDYIKFASNFLAEVGDFFLENKNYTTLASLPQEDPNFGNAKAGRRYMMRLKVYRSMSGSKPLQTSSLGEYSVPQDSGDIRETFTMYSNPKNFGELKILDSPLGNDTEPQSESDTLYNNFTDDYESFLSDNERVGVPFDNLYEINQWRSFVKNDLAFSYKPGRYCFNSGSGAENFLFFSGSYCSVGNDITQGENFPYTPPYYHGEAWADFTFLATESKKYTLAEILNDTSIEFYRYYCEDVPLNAESVGQIKTSRVFDTSKLSSMTKISFMFPRQYAAIGTGIGPFASSSNVATTYKQTIVFASASLFAGTPNNNEIYINYQTSGDLPLLHATLLAKAINGTADGDIKFGTMSGSVSGIHYFTANVDEVYTENQDVNDSQVKYVSLTGSSALGGYGNRNIETLPTITCDRDNVVYRTVTDTDAYDEDSDRMNVRTGLVYKKNLIKNYRMINEQAMQLASSVNLLSRGVLTDDDLLTQNGIVTSSPVDVDTDTQNSSRWIIQSKFETPMLNFNHMRFDQVHQQLIYSASATTIGMWHQYGLLPQSSSEGVFMQLEAVPENWIQNVMGGEQNATGSLLDLCGFNRNPIRMGEVADSKIVKEAIVAVPFLPRGGQRKFFNLDPKDVRNAQDPARQNLVGESVLNQINLMKDFVFPPSMDFITNNSVDPFAMYIFPFEHEFTKQDLSYIWQGLSPDLGISHKTSESTISHELLFHELLGRGAILKPGNNTEKELVKNARFKKINSRIRWMVFKVKQRANTNYFDKVFASNEASRRKARRQKRKMRRLNRLLETDPIQYNWPYDFFSLVELVKIDAEIDFANPDDDLTQDNRTVIRPREKVPRPPGPTKEERLARAVLGEPQEEEPAIISESVKKSNPKGGKTKRKETLRRKK